METIPDSLPVDAIAPPVLPASARRRLLRNPGVIVGGVILAIILLLGLAAPWLGTVDPVAINPSVRNRLPGFEESVRNDDGIEIEFRCSALHQSSSLHPSADQFRRILVATAGDLSIAGIERFHFDPRLWEPMAGER